MYLVLLSPELTEVHVTASTGTIARETARQGLTWVRTGSLATGYEKSYSITAQISMESVQSVLLLYE